MPYVSLSPVKMAMEIYHTAFSAEPENTAPKFITVHL